MLDLKYIQSLQAKIDQYIHVKTDDVVTLDKINDIHKELKQEQADHKTLLKQIQQQQLTHQHQLHQQQQQQQQLNYQKQQLDQQQDLKKKKKKKKKNSLSLSKAIQVSSNKNNNQMIMKQMLIKHIHEQYDQNTKLQQKYQLLR